MKKTISLFLLLAMIALAFASCGGKTEPEETTAPATTAQTVSATTVAVTEPDVTTAEATTVATTTDKWEVLGPEVAGKVEFQRTFLIELSEHSDAEKTSKNDQYVVGPDSIDPGQTPALQQFVYERNQAAIDLMNLHISYKYWDYSWGKQQGQIETVVQGQATDAPDLFVNMIYDLTKATLNGVFKDTWSIPGSYFDFETDGWMNEWMQSMSVTGDRNYILGGDYFLDMLRAMGVLPVNIDMMDANASKLAAYILADGQTLEIGEKLSEYFFDYVDDGKWTWATLHNLCEAIWVDTDGDNADSIGDVLGIIADNYGGLTTAIYIYSCGEENIFSVSFDEDQTSANYGKRWINYSEDSTALGAIFDAVATVYSGKGSMTTSGDFSASTPENPGAAYHRIKFAEGTLLTAGACVLGALEDEAFQTMNEVYTVVPLPKISEGKNYNTIIHNVGDAGAINVNSKKAVGISAFLQYCCEHSAEIREEFLEIVTKYKTTKYNQGTDRMLDIIYDSVINGRDKMLEDCIGTNDRFHVIMKNGRCEVTSSTLAEKYQSAVQTKQSKLDTIINTWYTLPKVEKTSE